MRLSTVSRLYQGGTKGGVSLDDSATAVYFRAAPFPDETSVRSDRRSLSVSVTMYFLFIKIRATKH